MALFGKKKKPQEAAPGQQTASDDDFSPEALAALAASIDSDDSAATGLASRARRATSFINGSVLGLNIGTESIKAVELTAKNGACSVTGAGIAPTPPDSISNGVVLSVNLLSEAIKSLLNRIGITSRKIVTSVAGTGEVIVRVIEVPAMTDNELSENIKTDLDRYIPFSPSEVQWDAAAMRDLPSDPGATNMDVLLVAARHELIRLHLELLESIKLVPSTIDVEPLAVARAVAGPLATDTPDIIDYNDVCAVLNIGASSTEISILRGDELVFTRTLPIGGNMMTQALVDELGITHSDAEKMKREMGNALPNNAVATPVTEDLPIIDEDDDFLGFDDDPQSISEIQDAADIDIDAKQVEQSADPFDVDFFNQGPQEEPGEQHQQKLPDTPHGDDDQKDLPSIAPQEEEVSDDDAALPSKTAEPQVSPDISSPAGGAIASFFDFDDELDEHSEQLPTIEGRPQHTEAPPSEEDFEQSFAGPTIEDDYSDDDDNLLPSVSSSSAPGTPLPSAFAFPEAEIPPTSQPTVEPKSAPITESSQEIPAKSTFAPLSIEEESPQEKETGKESPVDELDLSEILSDAPSESAVIDDSDAGLGNIEIGEDTGASGIDDLADGLGAGLDFEEKPADDQAVNAILKPILDDLTGELRRSLEYHSARYPDAPVTRLVLVGGGARMRNLDAYFTQNLGIPARVGNPLGRLKIDNPQIDPQLIEDYGGVLTVAMGLALRELIK